MAKKIIVPLTIILLLLSVAAHTVETVKPKDGSPAAPGIDVTLRVSKGEGSSRFVFEAQDEAFIKNTVVTPSQTEVKVQFPSSPNIRGKGNADIEASLRGKTYLLKPNHPFTVKVLKLSAPPRLSIDIIKSGKEESRTPSADEAASQGFIPLRIVLDPGHGGYDLGIISGDAREKDITLSVAKDLETALSKRSKAVSLTRKSDQFLSISERAIVSAQKSSDIFISLHLSLVDSFVIYTPLPDQAVQEQAATDVYALTSAQRKFVEKSKALAESLGKGIKDEFKADILQRDMSLPLLGSISAPAVLIELPKTFVYDKATRARLAGAILKGISHYATR